MAEWSFDLGTSIGGTKARLFKEDGKTYLHHHSPMNQVVEENKRLRTQPQKGRSGRIGARIPTHQYYIEWPTDFQMKHGVHPHRHTDRHDHKEIRRKWQEFVRAKVNSYEFSNFRIDDGKKL